jgi:DNA-directed RNA polymerase specialized sigma subunit
LEKEYMTDVLMREKLRQVGETEHRVARLKRRKKELKKTLEDVSLSAVQLGEKTSGGRRKDSTGEKAVKRIDWQAEIDSIDAEILRLLQERREVTHLMDLVLTEDENAVLTAKWIEGCRWDMVARRLHISRSSSFRISGNGLKKMVNAWNRRNRKSDG